MEEWFTTPAAAAYLGVSPSTVYRMEKRGLIHPIRTPGGQRRFSKLELDRYKRESYEITAPQNPSGFKDGQAMTIREEQRTFDIRGAGVPTSTHFDDTGEMPSPVIREWLREWDFRKANTKTDTHGFHTYPAMFIPQVARKLLHTFSRPGDVVLDIFCGSGTCLVEAKLLNRPAIGIELNPLAALIAKVKTTPIDPQTLRHAFRHIVQDYLSKPRVPISFPKSSNMDFWFPQEKKEEINAIKQAIERLDAPELIDFFYVALSEIIRLASFTKNGEFKLVRDKKKIEYGVSFDVGEAFAEVAQRNISGMADFYAHASDAPTRVIHGDATADVGVENNAIDLIVTSPPYGDSRTTVAYGQFSRLSAQWLDLIPHDKKDIDGVLLGGRAAEFVEDPVLDRSDTLRQSVALIAAEDERRAREVISFYRDLERAFVRAGAYLKSGGYFALVVGNRTVKGIHLKTDRIIAELCEPLGFVTQAILFRSIPNKRMPLENSPTNVVGKKAKTMHRESIVILQKV